MVNQTRHVAVCPDCQSSIALPPTPELWMRVTCPECGTQLEIVDDNPWELDYAEEYEGEAEDETEEADYEDFETAKGDDLDDDKDKPWNS
jgi:lysine biosynthesis protein LysW